MPGWLLGVAVENLFINQSRDGLDSERNRSMAGDMVRRIGESTGLGRVPRRVAREVERAEHRTLVEAADLDGLAQLTHQTMHHVALLSAEEHFLSLQAPGAEPRLREVVDTFTLAAAGKIARRGWR